jgi:hypothetical protein
MQYPLSICVDGMKRGFDILQDLQMYIPYDKFEAS